MSNENNNVTIEIPKSVANLIKSDEKVLWAGKPEPKMFNKNDYFLVPFSVIWLSVVIYWLLKMVNDGDITLSFAIFWGGIFIFAGIYLCFIRFFIKSNNNKNTRYLLTNKKAIIYYLNKKDIKKFNKSEMLSYQVKRGTDTIGSIIFLVEKGGYLILANTGLESISSGNVYGFFDVKNPEYLDKLIQAMR